MLQRILDLWLGTADEITPEADPAQALSHYIAAKIDLARRRPLASRVFANEVIHGAPQIGTFLENELNDWVARKAKVIDGWVKEDKMQPVDPKHLFFMLWGGDADPTPISPYKSRRCWGGRSCRPRTTNAQHSRRRRSCCGGWGCRYGKAGAGSKALRLQCPLQPPP